MSKLRNVIESIDSFECAGGVSNEEIELAEKKLNLKFSNEYKEYLLNYGTGFFDTLEPTGLNISKRINVVDVTIMERELKKIPKDMYVVENLGIDGLLILQNESGEIFEMDAHGSVEKIYNSLSDYINEGIA